MTTRTRFAPSPTGYLHIGGVRTALFCYLYARRHGGQFVLRIEDTDLARSTPESVQAILDGMAWLKLTPDEGPFYQTRRFDRYRDVVARLLDEGHAYRCYCTREELDERRRQQLANKENPRYDGRCRQRTEPRDGVDPVVRFRNPRDGVVVIDDLVQGKVTISNAELDDLIIARSDGTPTYNLTVVVDDIDMAITHVVRGDDHLNNTPRQINIMRALGDTPPHYAHVPMILGADGGRLSKRHGAVSVLQYRDDGFLPDALLNYLVRLGWSHGDQEIFTRDEMIGLFDIADVNRAASVFNLDKLLWLNHQYIQTRPPEEIAPHLAWHMERAGVDVAGGPPLTEIVTGFKERARTMVEMVAASRFIFEEFDDYEPKAAGKNFKAAAREPLAAARDAFAALPEWKDAAIHAVVHEVAERLQLGMGKVAQPLRVAATGTAVSPPIDATLRMLGRERTLARIDRALAHIG